MAKKTNVVEMADRSDEIIPYESVGAVWATIRIWVRGVTPLLTHNPATMGTAKSATRGSRIPAPEEEAEAGTYRDENGACCAKGDSFRGSLLGAATQWKAKRSTMASHLAHVTAIEDLCPLLRHDGTTITDYVIDRRRAIVARQGIVRSRPRFDEWQTSVTLQYDSQLVKEPKLIADILADAGQRMGIHDYRPQKKGPFGRYTITQYQLG